MTPIRILFAALSLLCVTDSNIHSAVADGNYTPLPPSKSLKLSQKYMDCFVYYVAIKSCTKKTKPEDAEVADHSGKEAAVIAMAFAISAGETQDEAYATGTPLAHEIHDMGKDEQCASVIDTLTAKYGRLCQNMLANPFEYSKSLPE